MQQTSVKAYAKINMVLNVCGKRDDGYHQLETVMQAVSLYDNVQIGWEAGGSGFSVQLESGRQDLPCDGGNIAYRAAEEMHKLYHPGENETITIKIEKNIPVAAGLGGGSSDAAAVIYGLSGLWGKPLAAGQQGLAAALGSDVPFFLGVCQGKPAALCTGRGEICTPVEPARYKAVILVPKIPVSAASVYKELQPADYSQQLSCQSFLGADWGESQVSFMGNHLQAPCLRLHPELKKFYKNLANANPLKIMLSGSGSCIFALFGSDFSFSKIAAINSPLGTGLHVVSTLY